MTATEHDMEALTHIINAWSGAVGNAADLAATILDSEWFASRRSNAEKALAGVDTVLQAAPSDMVPVVELQAGIARDVSA